MHVDKGSIEVGRESSDITTPPTELQTTDPPTESAVFSVLITDRGETCDR